MRKPNVSFGENYAIWYGLQGYALEIEYETFNWRVSMYRPIPVSRILRTTVYIDAPCGKKHLRAVVKAGMAMIEAWGGDEAICNGLPPNVTVCYTRR